MGTKDMKKVYTKKQMSRVRLFSIDNKVRRGNVL